MKEAALRLAESGVPVFPVGADKAPRTKRGFHDASTDPAVIERWNWNDGGMIGAAVLPGTVVIDVDPRNGGTETLKTLRETGHTLPTTRVVRTGGGGFHYYLRVPEDITLRAHLGPGVDVKRAGKGYVVVPPSPGYVFMSGNAPAEAPEWLIEELRVDEREGAESEPSDPKYFPFEHGTAYGRAALERTLGQLATAREGGRNDALNRAAFSMAQLVAGGELEADYVRDELVQVAERLDLPPSEIRATIASGWKAGEEQPRQAPERSDENATSVQHSERSDVAPVSSSSDIEATPQRSWLDWDGEYEEPPFFLYPLIPRDALIWVYGPTEASKSMVWVGLAAEASRHRVRASVYSFENPKHVDVNRLRRLNPDPEFFRLTHDALDLNDARQFMTMVEDEEEWGADLIVFDTYSHAFASRSDDGNAKAIEFSRRVRYLMARVGCTVVVVDHTGYEHAEEPRDASAKRQQADMSVVMKKQGEWHPGQPARFWMKNTKPARFGNPFVYNGVIRDTRGGAGLDIGWEGEHPEWRV